MANLFIRPHGRPAISIKRSIFSILILPIMALICSNNLTLKPTNYTEATNASYLAKLEQILQIAGKNISSSNNKQIAVSNLLDLLKLSPQTLAARLIYDDNYMRKNLNSRYPYLIQANGSYLGIRDYFNFDQVFWPTSEHLGKLNIEQMLYEEARALEITGSPASSDTWHYSDERELERSGGHLANSAKCRASMAELERELELASEDAQYLFRPGVRNMELVRWIDAWGRPVSETYQGSSFWLGSYRACRNLALELEASRPAETKFNYCWAKVAARDWPASDPMRPRMSVRVGVCLPDSCDTLTARTLAPTILKIMHFNFGPIYRKRFARLHDIYCLPVRPEPAISTLTSLPLVGGLAQLASVLPTEARVFLLLCLGWLALIALCSLREYYRTKRAQIKLVKGDTSLRESQQVDWASWTRLLSVQENYRTFTCDDKPPEGLRIDMRALGVPRLLASLLVVLGHSFINNYYFRYSSHLHILEGRKLGYHLFNYTWKSVEIFFVLSGILTSYTVLNKFVPKNKMHTIVRPRVWLTLNLIRFLRTAPLMMFMWAFVRTTFLHLGEGPYWDYGTNRHTFMGQCQHITWWRWLIYPILLDIQGNTGDPYQHECLSVSWYIVTDLKMFLLVPLYIYIIYSQPKWRWLTLATTVAVSTGWKYAQLHLQQLVNMRQIYSYGEMHAIHIFITFLDSAYYSPVDRFQALALGLTGGLYLYKYKIGQLKSWPWWMRGKLPLVTMLTWLLVDITRRLGHEIHFRQTGNIPAESYITAWIVMGPRLDALVFTLVALRLCTDWAPRVMRHTLVFYKLSKLSYCVYVVHSLIILYTVSSHERARPDTMAIQIFMLAAYVIVLSFLIAFPLYLLVESPITLLLNRIIAAQTAARVKLSPTRQTEARARAPLKRFRPQPSVTDNLNNNNNNNDNHLDYEHTATAQGDKRS